MSQRLPREEWQGRKQEPHTTQVLKYGKTGHMIQNAIFGLWDVLYIKWLP
jgi:hypothetical protein